MHGQQNTVRAKEDGVRVGRLKTCAVKNKILKIIWVDLALKRTRFCFRFILQCKEWVSEKAKPKLRIHLHIIYIYTMGSWTAGLVQSPACLVGICMQGKKCTNLLYLSEWSCCHQHPAVTWWNWECFSPYCGSLHCWWCSFSCTWALAWPRVDRKYILAGLGSLWGCNFPFGRLTALEHLVPTCKGNDNAE